LGGQLPDICLGSGQPGREVGSGCVLVVRPLRNFLPESFEVLVPGKACLVEEGDGVLHTDDLDLLELRHLIGRLRLLDDCLPNVLLEGLVGVGGVGKLRLEPISRSGEPLLGDFVDVSGSFKEGLVVPFDRSEAAIVAIEALAAGIVQLSKVSLRLGMLVDQSPEPAFGVPNLDCLFGRFVANESLFIGDRVVDEEHLDV
jgi:hypothetical protein